MAEAAVPEKAPAHPAGYVRWRRRLLVLAIAALATTGFAHGLGGKTLIIIAACAAGALLLAGVIWRLPHLRRHFSAPYGRRGIGGKGSLNFPNQRSAMFRRSQPGFPSVFRPGHRSSSGKASQRRSRVRGNGGPSGSGAGLLSRAARKRRTGMGNPPARRRPGGSAFRPWNKTGGSSPRSRRAGGTPRPGGSTPRARSSSARQGRRFVPWRRGKAGSSTRPDGSTPRARSSSARQGRRFVPWRRGRAGGTTRPGGSTPRARSSSARQGRRLVPWRRGRAGGTTRPGGSTPRARSSSARRARRFVPWRRGKAGSSTRPGGSTPRARSSSARRARRFAPWRRGKAGSSTRPGGSTPRTRSSSARRARRFAPWRRGKAGGITRPGGSTPRTRSSSARQGRRLVPWRRGRAGSTARPAAGMIPGGKLSWRARARRRWHIWRGRPGAGFPRQRPGLSGRQRARSLLRWVNPRNRWRYRPPPRALARLLPRPPRGRHARDRWRVIRAAVARFDRRRSSRWARRRRAGRVSGKVSPAVRRQVPDPVVPKPGAPQVPGGNRTSSKSGPAAVPGAMGGKNVSAAQVDAAGEAVEQYLGSWEMENATDLEETLRSLPDFAEKLAQSFSHIADMMSGHAVDSSVIEAMQEAASSLNGHSEDFRHVYDQHRRAHEPELRRLEEPRPQEHEWDITRNQ